jgi:hypothetical protein
MIPEIFSFFLFSKCHASLCPRAIHVFTEFVVSFCSSKFQQVECVPYAMSLFLFFGFQEFHVTARLARKHTAMLNLILFYILYYY